MLITNITNERYSTQLSAGLGLIEETKLLLATYEDGMKTSELHEKVLNSGLLPAVSARRLTNIISECFYPRYIKTNVVGWLKVTYKHLSASTLNQFFLVFTALANPILFDFIINIYWNKYASGSNSISTDDAKDFVVSAVQQGKTQTYWSESTIKRVSSYLIGCCADYGLLSSTRSSLRQFIPIRIHDYTLLFFAYWLHFQGIGDNTLINHKLWQLFGLDQSELKEELKRIAKNGWFIIQSAADVIQISWRFNSMEEVIHVITEN